VHSLAHHARVSTPHTPALGTPSYVTFLCCNIFQHTFLQNTYLNRVTCLQSVGGGMLCPAWSSNGLHGGFEHWGFEPCSRQQQQ